MDNGRIGRINPILKIWSFDHLAPKVLQDVSKEIHIMFVPHSFEEQLGTSNWETFSTMQGAGEK